MNDPAELQPVLEEKSEGPDVVPCYVQKEPAHKLVNLKDIPVLDVSGQASYHRIFDSCIPKWLNQAGVKAEYVKMEDVGLTGNDHQMMMDKNSDAIAKYFLRLARQARSVAIAEPAGSVFSDEFFSNFTWERIKPPGRSAHRTIRAGKIEMGRRKNHRPIFHCHSRYRLKLNFSGYA